jgi:hypothetical protein
MLFYGTANPAGETGCYDGLYLRRDEIAQMVLDNELLGKPVKVEHLGRDVGRVVSAWQYDGRLDLCLEIDDNSTDVETELAKAFVEGKVCRELSLGYSVEMRHSAKDGLRTGKKVVSEVSIVRVGARKDCRIHL